MGLQALLKRARFFLNQRRYDYTPRLAEEDFDLKKARHLLICKMDGKLGDTEVISPLIILLKEECPELLISVICPPGLKPLYEEILKIHTVTVPKKPSSAELARALKAFDDLPAVDVMFSTEPNFRARDFYVLHHFKPEFLCGIANDVKALNLDLKDRCFGYHITSYFREFLKMGGIVKKLPDYVPLTTAASLEKMRSYCADGQICLAPYGASVHRHLPDETIAFICSKVQELTGSAIALLVLNEQLGLKERLLKLNPELKFAALPESLSITELASVIDLSSAMISVDTANVHLACASHLPLYAIYSGHDPDGIVRWGPRPDKKDALIYAKPGVRIEALTPEDLDESLSAFLKKLKG